MSKASAKSDAAAAERVNGLDAIFAPKSVAVLGVTNSPGTVPHDIFVNLLDSRFNGVVYPVAPRRNTSPACGLMTTCSIFPTRLTSRFWSFRAPCARWR